jgi:hypothetical protein
VGNGDLLDTVVHKNGRLSDVVVSDILDSDHLPIIFHLLGHIRNRNLSGPVDKFTYWERFQSMATELISPRIEINSGAESDKAVRDFTASIASAYRLSTRKNTVSKFYEDLPGLKSLPKPSRGYGNCAK